MHFWRFGGGQVGVKFGLEAIKKLLDELENLQGNVSGREPGYLKQLLYVEMRRWVNWIAD